MFQRSFCLSHGEYWIILTKNNRIPSRMTNAIDKISHNWSNKFQLFLKTYRISNYVTFFHQIYKLF